MLLAYIFLVGPESFHAMARADTQYSQLSTLAWGQAGRIIEYQYDANGSLTSKTTVKRTGPQTMEFVEGRRYAYNLQNRLVGVWDFGSDDLPNTANDVLLAEYRYNPQGIRTEKVDYETSPARLTHYLIDPYNHTGYAQVLEETTYEDDGQGDWMPISRIHYTIGDDVISQTASTYSGGVWTAGGTQYLLYDGHGSTRQLVGENQSIQQSYNYDAYGTLLQGASAESNPGITPPQQTSLLYAGEQYDPAVQMYYNRARYYNPSNGLFNRVDPYSGNMQDPQSLHKYLYCHTNPVNNVDPTGMWSIGEVTLVQKIIAVAIGALAPAIITGYESAKANLGWGQIIANSAIAWALAFGFGVGMIFIGPAMCKAIITALTRIPGISIEMAKTALMVVGYGMLAYGMLGLWMSDYPLAVKISVTIVIALSIIVAVYKPGKTGGRLGNENTRDQNKQIAQDLKKQNYEITGGGGELPEEYLRGPGGGRKGSNYIDITAKHKDTGSVVRINTVDTRADGFTPTTREADAAASIRAKLPPGEHLILIPKNGG